MPPKLKKEEPWQTALGTKVFNPLQAMDMQDAIRKKAKSVTIDGKKFVLSYKLKGKVFYRPEHDFAPCGYLDIDNFLREI